MSEEGYKTCEERIDDELRRVMKDLKALIDAYESGESEDLLDYALCIDYVPPDYERGERGYIRYQMSWGGPSDEIRYYLDEQRRPYLIEYVYLDWYDGATRTLEGQDYDIAMALFDLLIDEIVDYLIEKAMEG